MVRKFAIAKSSIQLGSPRFQAANLALRLDFRDPKPCAGKPTDVERIYAASASTTGRKFSEGLPQCSQSTEIKLDRVSVIKFEGSLKRHNLLRQS